MIIKNIINKRKPFFSIITVVLNQKKISRVFKSLKNQSYKNFEHIVIDGGSTGGTLNIIKKNIKNIQYFQSKKDKGLYDAMNKGISKCRGQIIGILNSDDYYYKNCLQIAKKYFSKNKIDFLFGTVIKDRILSGYWPNKIIWKFNIYPSHSCGFFIKKKVQVKVGNYNQDFKFSADRDLIYRLIRKNYFGMCTKKNEVFGRFDITGKSSKVSFLKKLVEETRIRLNNNQNFITVIFLFIIHLFNKIFNIIKIK
jgi:glycosyltransferase involved in cell wall biosynthesis